MSIFRSAALYYGFAKDFSTTEREPSRQIFKINEEIDLTVQKINRSEGNPVVVIGKKVEKIDEGNFESISASELLQNITGIRKTPELKKALEDLRMQDQEPRLILCSEIS